MENKEHWEKFYKVNGGRNTPSAFAYYCLPKIDPGFLMDIGAGYGYDSLLFMTKKDIIPFAVEQSQAAIEVLRQKRIPFWWPGNILDLPQKLFTQYQTIYSRFSFHCFTDEEQEELINKISQWVKNNGLLCIECRSVKDELFGKGEQVGNTAFIFGHYRNFVVKEDLEQLLNDNRFEILESVESNGLAVYQNEDPVVIRIIARKTC